MLWKTKRIEDQFAGTPLQLEVLNSLDETIDELFEELQREGREAELTLLCPYFGVLWPSARVLAEEIAQNPVENNRGSLRILEVGCGLAIPSLVLLQQLRLSKLTACDVHPEVKRFLQKNLQLNHFAEDALEYQNWSFNDLFLQKRKWDLVIGSDILYESTHPAELAEAINQVTHPNGNVIITDPNRPYLQSFITQMAACGWNVISKVKETVGGSGEKKEIYLLKFKKK